ncbi:integrator complex subunit 5-like isoform X3 [Montipora capricornis]|uniref:integrator complex subunit 5-like isoform X3 n=1 Tax=Montipora capricornis TaxID=246305 RepID=UPI0035F16FA9
MADGVSEESKNLKAQLHSFLSGTDESGKALSNVKKTQSAIVLLHSLPCARHAVLEQLCDVFHEAVQKYVVELERQALSGATGHPADLDPELISALQNVNEVVHRFVDNNPTAWAPLICQWSLNLLGQVVTKNNGRRGVSITMSLSEGLHKWMLFPAVQSLMDIAIHCSAKLVERGQADVCVQCLLQIAMKSSPHLDWVVAHIGSHFHEVFIPKLLSTALKEYTASQYPGSVSGDVSVMTPTMVQVLTYLSLQHSQEIRSNLLALFHESIPCSAKTAINPAEQLATLPFLLHVATLSPNLLKGTIKEFLDALSPEVLVQLVEQSKKRGELKISLVSSIVDVIKNTGEGTFNIFQFLLKNCQESSSRAGEDANASQAEVKKSFILAMELLLHRLHQSAVQRHSLLNKNTSSSSHLDSKQMESEFLKEMACHSKYLCKEILMSNGNDRSPNIFRLLIIIAVHSGQTLAAGILNQVMINSRNPNKLEVFVHMYKELELYYPHILDDVVKSCLSSVKSPAGSSLAQLLGLLSNFHHLMSSEKESELLFRSNLSSSLQKHHIVFVNLLAHSSLEVSLKTLNLIMSMHKPMPDKVSTLMKLCSNCVVLFYKLLHTLANQHGYRKTVETMKRIKLCRKFFLLLCEDERCRLYLLRLLVEGILQKEHVHLFGGISSGEQGKLETGLTGIKVSLLERNSNPHISSHLPLTPSSVFFSGIVGDIAKSNSAKTPDRIELQSWLQTSQLFTDMVFTLCCISDQGDSDNTSATLHHKYVDSLALLLMEIVCPDVIPITFDWPDEDSLKFTIERDLRIRKTFDENPILWALISIVAGGVSSLSKCSTLMSSLLATVMSNWEVYRGTSVDQSSLHFEVNCFITDIMTKASWLPPPLSRVGAVFGLLEPKEIFTLLSTMWRVLKEFPPPSSAMTPEATRQRWQHGAAFKTQKEVVKAIFVNNIEKLGHHYARVFDESW